jgi:hypothetical protein
MSIDNRFALVTDTGEVMYPYVKTQKQTGRTGFALSTSESPDRHGGGEYTMDLGAVIRRVVFDGWLVRAKTPGGPGNSVGIGKRAIHRYWVAPEFRELVKRAPVPPLESLSWLTPSRPESAAVTPRTAAADASLSEEPPVPSTLEAIGAAAEIDQDAGLRDAPDTVRRALINARIGQGGYRRRMLQVWDGRCALTGIDVPEVLVASHAKSWADSSNEERLDEYNGLLLAGTMDRLFDAGLISFADDGRLLIGTGLNDSQLRSMGCPESMRLRTIDERHRPYLKDHRLRHGYE